MYFSALNTLAWNLARLRLYVTLEQWFSTKVLPTLGGEEYLAKYEDYFYCNDWGGGAPGT